MKHKVTAAFFILLLILGLCACDDIGNQIEANDNAFLVGFHVDCNEDVYGIHFEYYLDGVPAGGGLTGNASGSKITRGDIRMIDAAFDLGFCSVDGFTRAFTREFGMRPREYANQPVPITLFVPYGAKFRALRKEQTTMKNTSNVFIQAIHKPERKVICKRGVKAEDYFPYCEKVGCDVWGLLLSMDSLCGEPACLWLPEQFKKPNTSTYVQGLEAAKDYNGPVPEGFDVIDLPEADYLMFQGEPFAEEDYCEAIANLQQAMNGYDPGVIGYGWDDTNPRIQLEPRTGRGYIELRAMKHSA